MEKNRVYHRFATFSQDDREKMAALFARMGYTVRIGREKQGKSNQWVYYVEYWIE